MNLRIIRKNHAADSEIRFLRKLISKPYGRATAMPTAWELTFIADFVEIFILFFVKTLEYYRHIGIDLDRF